MRLLPGSLELQSHGAPRFANVPSLRLPLPTAFRAALALCSVPLSRCTRRSVDHTGLITNDCLWDYFLDRGYSESEVEALTRLLDSDAEMVDRASVVSSLTAGFIEGFGKIALPEEEAK